MVSNSRNALTNNIQKINLSWSFYARRSICRNEDGVSWCIFARHVKSQWIMEMCFKAFGKLRLPINELSGISAYCEYAKESRHLEASL